MKTMNEALRGGSLAGVLEEIGRARDAGELLEIRQEFAGLGRRERRTAQQALNARLACWKRRK